MSRLMLDVINRYFESFFSNIPEITKNWFILSKALFYVGAIFVYILAFIVLMTVILIVLTIAAPLSLIYKKLF